MRLISLVNSATFYVELQQVCCEYSMYEAGCSSIRGMCPCIRGELFMCSKRCRPILTESRNLHFQSHSRKHVVMNNKGNGYPYTLFYRYTPYFLYSYTLLFILTHPTFNRHTPSSIKLARRHARCTRSKLAILQHKSFVGLLS
jgi:hypothetical protein